MSNELEKKDLELKIVFASRISELELELLRGIGNLDTLLNNDYLINPEVGLLTLKMDKTSYGVLQNYAKEVANRLPKSIVACSIDGKCLGIESVKALREMYTRIAHDAPYKATVPIF